MPRARLSDEERRTRAILSNRRYRAENQQEYRTRERVRDRRFRHGLTIHEWIASSTTTTCAARKDSHALLAAAVWPATAVTG